MVLNPGLEVTKIYQVLRLKVTSLTTKLKVAKFSFLNENSYKKTLIDFNFGRHKDLSTRKSDNSPRPLGKYLPITDEVSVRGQ